jgi:hypothetical protein
MKLNRLLKRGSFLALFLCLISLGSVFGQNLTITTTVCTSATEVRMTGPFWSWNPTGGPVAVSNGDGTWTFSLPAPTTTMEYLLVVDGVQENLIQAMVNGGTCAPVTDYANYANRRWLLTDPLNITNTYGQCGTCGGSSLTQMNLPVTFEGTTVEYGVIGFEGAEASTIEVDPTNSANTVVKVIKSATAQPWAGTTITAAAALGLSTPIPFTASNQTMTLKVWSPDAGITVRLKVEEHGNNTHTVETDAVTTVAGQWETLTFNFANQGAGTAAINLAYTYDKPSVFFNYGVNGATAGVKTYYFDDLMMGTGGGGTGLTQMNLPVTFEGTTVDYGVIGFEGAEASTIEVDPTNSANTVVKVIKSATAQPWAGTTITAAAALGLATPIPFTATDKKMSLKVWSPDAGITVRLKVEEHGNNTHTVETDAVTTVAGQWETLTFNFANQGTGTAAINLAYTYDKASVFFNYGVNGATAGVKTYYFDDLQFVTTPPSPVTVTYQVDITDYISGGATLNTAGIRVGGNFTTVGASLPDWTPSNAACAMTDLGNGLWSIAVTYPASAIGTTQSYKFVNGDWGTNEGGSASLIAIDGCGINDNGNINRQLVIPATNTTYTFCWDKCTACGVVNLAQMTLPVTFQGTTTDYGVIGFEGAEASTIVADPTNANNTVVKVIKSATAQPWAGTTITAAAELGLATPIPFTASNKKMTLKVWSPDAGITVRLKVEEHGNNTHTVETDAVTTVAGQWETLTFDFANQGTGTAAINLAYTYDKPSVFFNYGVNGATAGEKTYYFDDLKMYSMPATGLQITVDVCSIAANEVRMTGPFWSWDPTAGPFAVNNNDGTWTFTLDPIPTTDMEYLIIVNGVQETLISDMQNGGNCAPVTDFFGYANRKWVVGSGNVNISYDRCVPCSYPDIVITTEVCTPATTVKLTGPIWQWNPNFGPTAVSNGDGTYTFTISPAPNDTLEYLLVKDGVVENLVQEMVNGGGCAPITDYSTYANRRWLLGQGAVANTYGKCSPCSVGIGEISNSNLEVFPNPTNASVSVKSEVAIQKIEVYSIVGELVATKKYSANEVIIDLEKLSPGVYTLNVFANDGVKAIRVIKN